MKIVAACKEKWTSLVSHKKCGGCGVRNPPADMHHVSLEVHSHLPKPLVVLRNLFRLLLGQKPNKVGKWAWLFGNDFMKLEKKSVKRWVCFNCYIKLLTPHEYQQFRDAYYHEMVLEDGQEKASEFLAEMDEVYAAREGVV